MILVYCAVLIVAFYLMALLTEEFFVPALDRIGRKLNLSSDASGATLMAIGSSSPEFFTSLFAVIMQGEAVDIGIGTIVGSAIFNVLVITGVVFMVRNVKLIWQVAARDIGFYLLSIIALLFTFYDGRISLSEAFFFVVLYVIYVSATIRWKKWFNLFEPKSEIQKVEEALFENDISKYIVRMISVVIPHPRMNKGHYLKTFIFSILSIALLSYALIQSAIGLSHSLNIHPVIIALTVIAFGTSIPDLLSSVVVAKQGRGDMAVSNAIGSNIFNILFGLGLPWLLVLIIRQEAIVISTADLVSGIFLLYASVLALLALLVPHHWKMGFKSGLTLIGIYVGYLLYSILRISGV